jgi:hypothetical protein
MSETTKAPRIVAAMARVMAEVGAVGKSRKNSAQNYAFRGVDDVVAHVQEVMAKCGVIVIPRVVEREREMLASKSGGSMVSVRLLVEHTFYCEEDGSSVVCTTLGEAMDSGDKASNKAMSAALKYCLTESLLIPTYEVDRDTEEHSPQVASSMPAGRGLVPAPHRPSPPAPPSNVTPIAPPSSWEIRINEADSVQALATLGSALQREPEAVRNAARPVYTRRFTELSARVGR